MYNIKCKLTGDVVLPNQVTISKDTVIDLNGNKITTSASIHGGIIVVANGTKLTVNDATGKGAISNANNNDVWGGIQVGSGDASKVASLVVNGGIIEGYYYGVVGNGTRHNTAISINGGTIKGYASDSLGIYHPQEGTLTVNGGTITGGTGIEMRSGTLVVNNGVIRGETKPVSVTPNGSGSTVEGAGIAVSQHTTKKPINVTVNGGTIEGFNAFWQTNPQGNSDEDVAKVKIKIAGGEFNAINGGTVAIVSDNCTDFITGGTFNTAVDKDYIALDYDVKTDANGNVTVVKENVSTTDTNNTKLDDVPKTSNTFPIILVSLLILATGAATYTFKNAILNK